MIEIYRWGWRLTRLGVAGLLLLMLASHAEPQPRTVPEEALVVEGRVLWVDFGGQTMLLDPAVGGPPVMIDVRRLAQSDYSGFRGDEYVRIVGFVLRPSRRIQAFELYLVTPWFPVAPQGP